MRVGVTTPGAPEHAWFGWLLARAGLSVAHVRVSSLGGRGLVSALDSGEIHAALVHEPVATQLLGDKRVKLLADFRTPRAVTEAFGASTVNAALFARADRRPKDRDLLALTRALQRAEERIRSSPARELAAKLSVRVVGEPEDFAARLAAARALYLSDGFVSADQVQQTLAIIRAHTPLPQAVPIPRAEDMLLQIKVPPAR